ncbi:hypothetical protein [Vallitalea sp.]|jgi:hypothetical protein|uniref:hypothetical protein n=1 Tax=Vallitalea sp. TaxID=1882829 RepID=UPI0025F10C26|nr:hypothetical protein [Vallitalea sp.]MCT4688682.1 hypothetical protein [Vallitalea sp.]
MNKRKGLWITSMCLVVFLFVAIFNLSNTNIIKAASDLGFEWKKNDTMDKLLKIVSNKAGDDEVLINWKLNEYGLYTLEYYLTDKIKTQVTFEHQVNQLIVKYNMIKIDTTKNTETSITETEFDKSFAKMNYTLLVPQLESITKKDGLFDGDSLKFTIIKGASSKYPGASFVINNLPVRFRWNMQTKTVSFLTKGIQKGCIVPFEITTPDTTKEKLQLLKAFNNFKIVPTHWVKDTNNNTNKDIETIEIPSDSNIRPGSKPGLRITFDRPKIFNTDNDKLQYEIATIDELKKADGKFINAVLALKDIRDNGDNTDIIIPMDVNDGKFINPPNLTTGNNKLAEFDYNSVTGTYTIELVKDRSELHNDANIALKSFLQWDDLGASRVYTAAITLEESPNYQFNQYEPTNKYAYTYLDYIVKRASMDDAYLDIVPYAGSNADDLEYTIYHSKTKKSKFDDDDIWLKHYHKKENSDLNIYIPVPFKNGSTQEFYQVGIQFAGSPLRSQTIKYVPTKDKNVPPPVPRIKEIKNLAVVPPDDLNSTNPDKVQFDLTWHAPDKDLLNNMLSETNSAIYYEMLFNDIPTEETNNKYTITKVFKVYKDGANIKVEEVDSGMEKATPSTISGYQYGYNANENLFQIKNIVIRGEYKGSPLADKPTIWSKPIKKDLGNKIVPYTKSEEAASEYDYEFPGINFIKMRSVYIIPTGGVGQSDRSIADSISLSMLRYDIPMVGNINYTPRITTEQQPRVGLNVKFKLVDIKNYNDHMISPINKKIKNINYRIYISKDKQKILKLDSLMTTIGDVEKILDLDNADREKENGVYKIADYSDDIELTLDEIDKLRSNNILYSDIQTKPTDAGFGELKLLNLDPNTNYYIRIVTKLDICNVTNLNVIVDKRRSEPSSMLSTTSPVVPSNPGDNELIPLAPENMEVKHLDDSMISGKISWEFPSEIELVEDKYGFELISIENKSLPKSLGSGKMLQDIFDSKLLTGVVIEGWRLYVKDKKYILKYYDKNTKTWIDAKQTFKVKDNKISIIDNNNLSNKVYYYYVRTIRIESEIPKSASAWVADSLTTAPIRRPINLIVDHNSKYSYDPKRETVIRFDAPIPTDYNTTGNYGIEIFVKGDKDTDYSNTKYSNYYLEQVKGANDGYTRVFYKISGLKPGTTYSIKVRIEDRTKPQDTLPNGDKVYPRSSFSDRVSTRTEFNQKDYDKENKYIGYIKYYEDKAQELIKKSYWEIEKDDKKQVIKYRQDYNIGDLKYVKEGNYYLVDAIKGVQEYYLPAKMIETANDNGITIMIKFPNGDLGIRPYALSKDKTAEILDKIDEINKYSSSTRDYYVRLVMNIGEYKDKINGKLPSTNLLNYDVQVVGSNISEDDLEKLIIQKFEKTVESKKTYLIKQLDKELESGIDDAKLLKIVTDTLKLVKETHRTNIKSMMKSYIQTKYSTVNEFNQSIRMTFNVGKINDTLQGYRRDGSSFTRINSDNYGGSYNIETYKTGSYLFTPKSNMYSKLDNIYNGMVTDLVTQYRLTDIFNSGELSNLNYKVYNYQLLSATARVLGAEKGYDNKKWLKEQNIDIPVDDMYGHMRKDEVMYIFMQAYSIKNNLNLDSINVTDYNIIEDADDIQEEYRDVLIKGVNLGIIKLTDGRLLPNKEVVTETVLEMLTRINNKIDW